MPRASKRGKPCEHELPPHLVVGKPTLASSPGKDMRREDSSEAASAVTLTPPIPSLKSQQEASTCPVMYSHSAQSSQGCENTLPSLMLRELEILNCKLGFALLEVANRPAWEFVRDVLDESIASLLKSNETDTTRHRLTVDCKLQQEETEGFYLKFNESEEVEPVTCEPEFENCKPEAVEVSMAKLAAILEGDASPCGMFWQKLLQRNATEKLQDTASTKQIIASLLAVLPEELWPATESKQATSWLAFSEAGAAATDLRLHVGSSFWLSGFSRHAAALRPVYFSVPQGKAIKAVLKEDGLEDSHRTWVVQEDQEAAVGAELVLEALRTQACREESTAVVNPWEEVDSQAVVLGPKNEVGGASEVIQRPGQVLALQRQGHCSVASGGVFLAWNVACGAEWPQIALNEGRVRSNAVRRAAVLARNAWLGVETRQHPPPLHVLRLLFAVACNIGKADETLVEGLQKSFVPLCKLDIKRQSHCCLPHMNAKRGVLESRNHSALRCSCCSGEFLFSYVGLIKRKGERGGSLCWQCWSQRESLGLQEHCRNARKCTVLREDDLQRLIAAVTLPAGPQTKRAKRSD